MCQVSKKRCKPEHDQPPKEEEEANFPRAQEEELDRMVCGEKKGVIESKGMNNSQSNLKKENQEANTLVEENVEEEFDGNMQFSDSEGKVEGVSPILRIHEDEIIRLEPCIFEPKHKKLVIV